MKMRDLEQQTGVSREVIRIMIRQGLLPEPHRPARNSAIYDDAHVRGVRAIRALQRSSRMTLKEIKRALHGDGVDAGSPSSAYAHLDALLTGLFGIDEAPSVPLATLISRFPDAGRDAAAFERLGMLRIIKTSDGEALTLADARLVEIWAKIREAGFVEEAGFPPDNIGFYLEAAQTVARQEADIFFGNRQVSIDDDDAARMLHIALPLMLDFFGHLRLKAFMAELENRKAGVIAEPD